MITDNNGWAGQPGVPLNPERWRGAINDALTNWLSPIEDHETPADALRRLIRLEVDAALDPAVSQAAAGLVTQARRDALEEAARRAAKIVAERNQLIGILHLAVEQSEDMEKEPAWFDVACRILNAGFTRALKGEGDE